MVGRAWAGQAGPSCALAGWGSQGWPVQAGMGWSRPRRAAAGQARPGWITVGTEGGRAGKEGAATSWAGSLPLRHASYTPTSKGAHALAFLSGDRGLLMGGRTAWWAVRQVVACSQLTGEQGRRWPARRAGRTGRTGPSHGLLGCGRWGWRGPGQAWVSLSSPGEGPWWAGPVWCAGCSRWGQSWTGPSHGGQGWGRPGRVQVYLGARDSLALDALGRSSSSYSPVCEAGTSLFRIPS